MAANELVRGETELPAPDDQLRQGDILRTPVSRGGNGPSHFGAIINADCDLTHGKTDGVISYLPVYSFRTYVEEFWAPIFAEDRRKEILRNIRTICDLKEEEEIQILNWLNTDDHELIADRLEESINVSKEQNRKLRESLYDLKCCFFSGKNNNDVFKYFCDKNTSPKKYAHRQIYDAYKRTIEGHLFINEILGLDDIGFVIRMRRIYSIPENLCFRSMAEQRAQGSDPSRSAVRISRLTPFYRFRMAQLFAYQFSRIGLPDEITALRELSIENLVQEIVG